MKDINSLINQARAGDGKSYWAVVELFYEEIFRFCRKKLFFKNQKAEDATHDSFVKMMERMKNLEEPDKFKSYLYRIAYTICIDRLKYCNRFVNPREEKIDFLDTIESANPNPEEATIAKRENNKFQRIREALEKLSDEHRQIIKLVHFENRSYQNVADTLNIPIGTVRSRLNRALGKLKSALGEMD